jgi:hypothetical protein
VLGVVFQGWVFSGVLKRGLPFIVLEFRARSGSQEQADELRITVERDRGHERRPAPIPPGIGIGAGARSPGNPAAAGLIEV